jgi:predicted component of type VI protein secretion system
MEVRLKILVGQNVGHELPIRGPKFLVGRAEDCNLRARSDLISRHHCAILVEPGLAVVRDFGSKNGTLVNGERVIGEHELHNGDQLTIGPLTFEVILKTAVATEKRPKVTSVREAAARAAEGPTQGDLDVNSWLDSTAEEVEDAASLKETRRITVNETDEIDIATVTQGLSPLEPRPAAPSTPVAATVEMTPDLAKELEAHIAANPTVQVPAKSKPKLAGPTEYKPPEHTPAQSKADDKSNAGKGTPGKLPKSSSADSGQAASDVLKKFFRRR